MKICRTCQRCYDDADTACVVPAHGPLAHARPGPRLIADKYRLDRLLGRGGMGAVYAGTHVELDRAVAIKLLLPELVTDAQALERFRREARTAAKINHPNVADTYDYGTLPDGEAYLVMELVEGQTLREYLHATGPLGVPEAAEIAREVAAGIDAAHHYGIVHRDLKPSNIILARTHQGALQPKVVDFGIAKLKEMSTTSGQSDLTAAGALIGTPRYMSPEQCAGSEADTHSDIYTLGIILYEMLTGRPPFDAPSATAVALKHVREPPPDVRGLRPDLPPALADLIMQSLAKNPNDRPRTAAEFAARLDSFAAAAPALKADPFAATIVLGENVARNTGQQQSPPTHPTTDYRTTPLEIGDGTDANTPGPTDRAGMPTREEETPVADEVEQSVRDSAVKPARTETVTRLAAARPTPAQTETHVPVTAAVAASHKPPVSDEGTRTVMRPASKPRRGLPPILYASIAFFLLCGIAAAWLATRRAPVKRGSATPTATPLRVPAASMPTASPTQQNTPAASPQASPVQLEAERASLRAALDDWLAATNERNLERVMSFYLPLVETYYRDRNVLGRTVRADKAQMLTQPGVLTVRLAGEPQITFNPDGQTATMIFHKPFVLGANEQQRDGEVLQELKWQKTAEGWRIAGERDLQIIR